MHDEQCSTHLCEDKLVVQFGGECTWCWQSGCYTSSVTSDNSLKEKNLCWPILAEIFLVCIRFSLGFVLSSAAGAHTAVPS